MEKIKIKVIQISSTSPSFFLSSGKGNIDRILKDDWFAQVAKQLKKNYPKIDIECWAPEKNYKKEKQSIDSEIKFRVFPSAIPIRAGMEISPAMINALKEEIKKAERENKKLILHFHEYHSWLVYLLLLFLKKNKDIKIIAQHHGGRSPFRNLAKYKRLILLFPIIALMQFFENLLFKKIDIFYALSDEEIAYLKNIAPQSNIKFQIMGIPDECFKQVDKQKTRKKLGLKNKKYVLYIGRLKTTKGIKELLDAMKKLNKENIELLLIGKGTDFNRFKEYARQQNIRNVNFLGAIYGKERLLYLDASDCLILPSYTEGAPVVLMEAIARNLPVIATNVGGIPKMIENGREGIIIKPKSGVEIVRAIKKILTWKKKNIKKYAEKYKWEKIIKETFNDYKYLNER